MGNKIAPFDLYLFHTMAPLLSRTGHAVAVVCLCFFIEALTLSSRSFFAVAMTSFERQFSLSRTAISACRAVQLVTQALVTPLGGQLADASPRLAMAAGLGVCGASLVLAAISTTAWQLFLTYGFLAGIGYGATNYNVAAAIIIVVVPERRRGLATGIATSGSPVGQMVLVPLFERVLNAYGWRPGFAWTGAFMILLAICSFAVLDLRLSGSSSDAGREDGEQGGAQRKPQENAAAASAAAAAEEGGKKQSDGGEGNEKEATAAAGMGEKLVGLFRAPWFWLLAIPFFICGITAVGVVETHLFAMVVGRGIESSAAAWSFGVLMLANGVGIIVSGALSDVASRSAILAAIFFIRALTFVLLRFSGTDLGLLFTFAVVFGFVDYGVVPPTAGLVSKHAGDATLGLGFGVLLALHSGGAAFGAIAAGALYDADPPLGGNYGRTILACAVLCVVAGTTAAALNERPLWRGSLAAAASEEQEEEERRPSKKGLAAAGGDIDDAMGEVEMEAWMEERRAKEGAAITTTGATAAESQL